MPKSGLGYGVLGRMVDEGDGLEKNQNVCCIYIFCIFAADFKNSFL
ncbi:MAG: hypothetical protein IJK85_10595 [Bacteroidales bacterium]|nr:hypothetical protein [Bacteroidales bacterium]